MASTIATIFCGIGTLEVYGIGYKLFLAVETGIFITAGTLPLIVLVVFFSKTYVFSILLCVFYLSLIHICVSNIEITDSNIKAFESTAKKYNIDFSLKKVKGEQTLSLIHILPQPVPQPMQQPAVNHTANSE